MLKCKIYAWLSDYLRAGLNNGGVERNSKRKNIKER